MVAVGDDRERRVEIDGDQVVVAFSNKGARVVSWQLRQFTDEEKRPEEMVETVPGGPRPLDIETGDQDLDQRLREALFKASAETVRLGSTPQELRFQYADSELTVEKWLRFPKDGYEAVVGATVQVGGASRAGARALGSGGGKPNPGRDGSARVSTPTGRVPDREWRGAGLAGRGGPREPWRARAGSGSRASTSWRCWCQPAATAGAEVRGVSCAPRRRRSGWGGGRLALGGEGRASVYVGPKDHEKLSTLGHDLARVVPVGDWIGPIVVGLMKLFRWVNGYVGNYGWSVVVLTILISLVMAPFRHYSIANGLKMAKIAPEMKVIQERYRKIPMLDPKRQDMNQEMAELYARHGMNMSTQMLVGCLPILLTMPFLIAFYRVLDVSIELRGAPFLWIGDLSQKDPYFISPVLMGLSMFLMQKMTPTAMDPAQQRIMLIMPVVLSVMFFFAPAGLNLYWLVSNIASIVQQGVTMKVLRDRDARIKESSRKEEGG